MMPTWDVQEAIYSALTAALAGAIYTRNKNTNLVTNGDFSDGATGWTLGAGWSVSPSEAYAVDPTGTASLSQTLTVDAGTIWVQVQVNSVESGSASVQIDGNEAFSFDSPGTYCGTATAATDNPTLAVVGSSDFMGEVDNIRAHLTYAVPVYDSVEQGQSFPYVTLDYFDLTNQDMLNQRMDNDVFYFAVWSDYRGQREIMDILAAMDAALHEKRLTLDSGRVAQMRTLTMRTNREPDGLTYMGQYRLGVLVEH